VYRPAATFAATGHYAVYLLCTTPIVAAFCVGALASRWRWIFRMSLGLQCVAVMTSGARLALLFVPVGVIVICLSGIWNRTREERRLVLWRVLGSGLGVALVGLIAGSVLAPTGWYRAQSIVKPSTPRQLNIADTLTVSFQRIRSLSGQELWWAHGLGSASPGVRYLGTNRDPFVLSGLAEGAVGQLIWESGIPGLVSFVVSWLTLLVYGAARAARIRDPLLWSLATAIIVLHCFLLVTAATYALMTLPPLTVYFWLSLGILAALPGVDVRTVESARR
jgi:hypothetical protein